MIWVFKKINIEISFHDYIFFHFAVTMFIISVTLNISATSELNDDHKSFRIYSNKCNKNSHINFQH